MLNFRHLPIRKKLLVLSATTSVVALLSAGSAMLSYDWFSHRQAIINKIQVLATVIGNRSTAALVFDDKKLAEDNLKALASEPRIQGACIYNGEGSLFASYIRETNNRSCDPKFPWQGNAKTDQFEESGFEATVDFAGNLMAREFSLWLPIKYQGNISGVIKIDSDFRELDVLIKRDSLIMFAIIFVAAIIAIVFASRIQKLISNPILQLRETTKAASASGAYSLQTIRQGDDELGALVTTFKEMLAKIERQKEALLDAKDRYVALYDDNPTMLITIDRSGILLSVNEFGARQLALAVKDMVGRSIFEFLYSGDKPLMESLINCCTEHPEKVYRIDLRLMRKDRRLIWVRETARQIRNVDGNESIFIVFENITEARKLSEELSFHASHDPLTGLVNRREFKTRLERALAIAKAEKHEHALCFMDLDQFKVINDTCGHSAGDELLRQLVGVMKERVRRTDTLARIGGDEFAVLLESCTLIQAERCANDLRLAIAEFQFAWENRSFNVGASIGLVSVNHQTIDTTEVMKQADAACYAAKDKGRNRIHTYRHDDEEMTTRQSEMQWVAKINMALEENRFELACQSIIPVKADDTEKGDHYEILVRMKTKDGKTVPPGAFLPAAERYNLSGRIDRWVVRATLNWLMANPAHVANLSLCAINLSGLTLGDDEFLGFVKQQFERTGIPPHKICFEITETAAITNLRNANRLINALREQGCRFSLDDFGSGLSSFAYLKNLPVDYLKIDGQFVKDIADDPIDLTMVKSIHEVGRVMGKKTIAEFVENDAILDKLRLIGVDYAQGFGIGKPRPLAEMITLREVV